MGDISKIAIIGAGAMGSSILRGWISSDEGRASALRPANFTVIDPGAEKRSALSDELGVETFEDISSAAKAQCAPDMVLVAVKPQVIDGVLKELAATPWFSDADGAEASSPLVVSIAAGVPTLKIASAFDSGARVVRVMPNLPLQVGLGASVVAGGDDATPDEVQLVCDLFDCLGFASEVEESKIDAVCAISGGGPAYVAKMIEDLTSAGVKEGLSAELAEKLALVTVGGSYKLLADEGLAPCDMRAAVCSPGGTTLAALAAMDEVGFSRAIDAGVVAAIDRAKELAQ